MIGWNHYAVTGSEVEGGRSLDETENRNSTPGRMEKRTHPEPDAEITHPGMVAERRADEHHAANQDHHCPASTAADQNQHALAVNL